MPKLIPKATIVQSAGNKPKSIEEFVGRVNTSDESVSIAKMTSPPGWIEPGQTPEFCEYALVLNGMLKVEFEGGMIDVHAGQGVVAQAGEWVRYSTPDGAEYVAVCVPAFSPQTVHRDED
jgi:quercetin dioxygenase-like cupin family protein